MYKTTTQYACADDEKPVEYEAYGKIHCDIFNINKYMLNNIDIKLVFSRSTDDFCLFGAKNLKDHKATPTPELVTSGAGGYTAMFYLEFDNIIEIIKERQV